MLARRSKRGLKEKVILMIDIYDLEKVLVSKISFKNLIDLRTKKYLMDINYPSLYVFWFNNYDGAIKNLALQ
jgi:hypothetical protein